LVWFSFASSEPPLYEDRKKAEAKLIKTIVALVALGGGFTLAGAWMQGQQVVWPTPEEVKWVRDTETRMEAASSGRASTVIPASRAFMKAGLDNSVIPWVKIRDIAILLGWETPDYRAIVV
jgi:hypothetical protein